MLSWIMDKDYPLTQLEYAKILGISKEALRSRRRLGKLDGQFVVKSNQYFYARPRPKQVNNHTKKPRLRNRRRGVHKTGQQTNYTSNALRQHNEMKMLAKIQYNADQETLDLLPEALNTARELKKQRLQEAQQPNRVISKKEYKNYGRGIYNTKHAYPQYRPLGISEPKKKERAYY